jgi:hypothetical protein
MRVNIHMKYADNKHMGRLISRGLARSHVAAFKIDYALRLHVKNVVHVTKFFSSEYIQTFKPMHAKLFEASWGGSL